MSSTDRGRVIVRFKNGTIFEQDYESLYDVDDMGIDELVDGYEYMSEGRYGALVEVAIFWLADSEIPMEGTVI